jgi:hypothetical protein
MHTGAELLGDRCEHFQIRASLYDFSGGDGKRIGSFHLEPDKKSG